MFISMAALLITSCFSTGPVKYVSERDKNIGCMVASFVKTGTTGVMPDLSFKKIDGPLKGWFYASKIKKQKLGKKLEYRKFIRTDRIPLAAYRINNVIKYDYAESSKGGIVTYDLPVGKYIINGFSSESSFQNMGTVHTTRVQNANSFKVPFTVNKNQCTYIGEYNWIGIYPRKIGNEYKKKIFLKVSDQYSRDIRLFNSDYPEKSALPITKIVFPKQP